MKCMIAVVAIVCLAMAVVVLVILAFGHQVKRTSSDNVLGMRTSETTSGLESVARNPRRESMATYDEMDQSAAPTPGTRVEVGGQPFDTGEYDNVSENRFMDVATSPLSTLSIDVDTASYANVRRMIESGRLPVEGAVRLEEMINYFDYDYPEPDGDPPPGVYA